MSTVEDTGRERNPGREQNSGQQQSVACYVYGVVPSDVELTSDAHGLGDRDVDVIRHGDIAALVSEIEVKTAIGRPEDLAAHEQLLDGAAVAAPVLPFRFGAVMTDADSVVEHLLAANHDTFARALRELEGRTEYIVKARYHDAVILDEVVSENEEASRLREQIRGKDEDATRNERVQLGEYIHNAIEAKRNTDTDRLVEALADHSITHAVLDPTHEYDAADAAFLVEDSKHEAFEKAVDDFAEEREGRMTVRLLGPLAPYDFVVTNR